MSPPIPMVETQPSVAPMVHHCRELLGQRMEHPDACRGLLVGCGTGEEVVFLRRAFRNRYLVGLDVNRNFSASPRAEGCLLTADASSLPFPAASLPVQEPLETRATRQEC